MKWSNALGFCLVGLGMLVAPAFAPALVSSPGGMEAGARETWLLFMGALNTSLGAGALGWQALGRVRRIAVWVEPVAVLERTELPRPEALPEPSRI